MNEIQKKNYVENDAYISEKCASHQSVGSIIMYARNLTIALRQRIVRIHHFCYLIHRASSIFFLLRRNNYEKPKLYTKLTILAMTKRNDNGTMPHNGQCNAMNLG